jgi:hypothetical protein
MEPKKNAAAHGITGGTDADSPKQTPFDVASRLVIVNMPKF